MKILLLIGLLTGSVLCAGEVYPDKAWSNVPDVSNREFWEAQRNAPGMAQMLKRTEKVLSEPIVSPVDDYLEFSKNGNRSRYEKAYRKLSNPLGNMVLAACITRDERYIDNIVKRIEMLAALPTWVLPAHDKQLVNYNGKAVEIDLGSATLGVDLACLLRVLSPALPPDTVKLLESELMRRLVVPFEDMMNKKRPEAGWIKTKNNWNSVCLAGMTAVLLRVDLEPERRAKLLDYVVESSRNFLAGFGKDGYCSEGVSYWSYGFGYYMQMAADFRQSTAGKVDLMNLPEAKLAARFADTIQLVPGVFPAFADCDMNTKIPGFTIHLQAWLEGRVKGFPENYEPSNRLSNALLVLSLPRDTGTVAAPALPPETIFEEANVFVARPGSSSSRLAVAFKGGSNAEFHNHNDVGSYIIAVDGVPVIVDPGREIYTARTFSGRRYESKLLNSYGHGVPKIDGKLQTNKGNTKSICLKCEKSLMNFQVTQSIRAAYYHIPGVQELSRGFDYSREGAGAFTITDTAVFKQPLEYENAVITLGTIEELGHGKFRIAEKGKKLILTIDCGGKPFTTSTDVIREDTHHKRDVYRLAIRLDNKVDSVCMVLKYEPEN